MVSVALNFDVNDFNKFLEELKGFGEVVEAGLVATGPAAAYAEVWEWGNARQTKKGPRTVLGVNPDGETVWLSTQAPMGYIGIHSDKYIVIVENELSKLVILDGHPVGERLRKAAHNAMIGIKEVVSENAPVDSGALRDCFRVVDDGDAALSGDTETMESRFRRVLTLS